MTKATTIKSLYTNLIEEGKKNLILNNTKHTRNKLATEETFRK